MLNIYLFERFDEFHDFNRSTMYQSTGSLHSDSHSSNSMSPAPSPSPTHLKIMGNHHHAHHQHRGKKQSAGSNPSGGTGIATPVMPSGSQPRNLSGSMSNLSLSGTKKWGSTSDFREPSPGPQGTPTGGPVHRRLQQTGSMSALRYDKAI